MLTIGIGLYMTNRGRLNDFPVAHDKDPAAFVSAEIERVDRSMNEYQMVVFRVIPGIIVVFALLFIFLPTPTWRAISISTIAMMIVILVIDSNANARITEYGEQLKVLVQSS